MMLTFDFMTTCLNCNKELIHVEGRRKKKFCGNSCRVTYWQKTHAKSNNKPISEKDVIEIATNATKGTNPATKKKFDEQSVRVEKHFTIEVKNDEQQPERKEGESKFDYRVRMAEWHDQKNKK